MKVLLVSPPYHRLKGKRMGLCYPLGIGYLSSALQKAGFETAMYGMNASAPGEGRFVVGRRGYRDGYLAALNGGRHPAWDELRSVLDSEKPDVLGVSIMTLDLGAALEVSRIAKEAHAGLRIVWGGPHPTACPDDCLSYGPVDFVVRGEGEAAVVDLCRDLQAGGKGDQVAGVSVRTEQGVRHNPAAPLIADLNSLAPPDRTRLLFRERFHSSELAAMFLSRGCPFRCGFCATHIAWGKKVRYRSADNVAPEVDEVVASLSPGRIRFQDDSFTLKKSWAMEIAAMMAPKKVTWACYTRADLLDAEVLAALKAGGCAMLGIGLESGSPRMLEATGKGEDLETIRRGVREAKKQGFFINLFLMYGLPGETRADIEATLRVAEELGPDNLSAEIFGPLPGTALTDVCKEMSLLPAEVDWLALSNSERGIKMDRTGPIDRAEFARIEEEVLRFLKRYELKRLPPSQFLRRAFRKVWRTIVPPRQ